MDYLWEEVLGVKMALEMFMTKAMQDIDLNKI
jgi:hypothetical protein